MLFQLEPGNQLYYLFEKISNLLAGSKTLFLIDDIIADETLDKCCQLLLKLAILGRHRGHSLWLLTSHILPFPIISGDRQKCIIFGTQKTEQTMT